jgi:hypothetical protein
MSNAIIPFNCYPQFRAESITTTDLDYTWRECAILDKRISMSVMPLLTNEITFDSFARHEGLWKFKGCDLAVRRADGLEALVREHDRLYSHLDHTEGQLDQKLKRAAYLEKIHGANLKVFSGGMANTFYRSTLSDALRRALRGPELSSYAETGKSLFEAIASYDGILDLAGAEKLIAAHGLDQPFNALARTAYYDVGAAQFGADRLVPAADVVAIPASERSDLIATAISLANREVNALHSVSRQMIAELPLDDVIALSNSQIARSFAAVLRKLVEEANQSEDHPDELAKVISRKLAERIDDERFTRNLLDRYEKAGEATHVIGSIWAALESLSMLSLIGFAIFLIRKLRPDFGLTPVLTYVDVVREKHLDYSIQRALQ